MPPTYTVCSLSVLKYQFASLDERLIAMSLYAFHCGIPQRALMAIL